MDKINLKEKILVGYFSRIFIQGVTMIIGIIVARIAGPDVLGKVAFAMSFISIFQFISDLGTGTAHIKLISEKKPLGDCISTFARIKLFLTSIFTVIVILVIIYQYYKGEEYFVAYENLLILAFWLVSIVISQIMYIPITTFSGLTLQAKQDIPFVIQSIINQFLRLFLIFLGLGAIGLSIANMTGIMVAFLMYFVMFRNFPKGKYSSELASKYLKISVPIIIIGFSTNFLEYIDKVIIGFLSNTEQTGIYATSYSFCSFIKMIGNISGMLFLPVFSNAIIENKVDSIKQMIDKYQRFLSIFILPASLVLIMFTPFIIKIFLGNKYLLAENVLPYIIIGMFFSVFFVPYGNLMLGYNYFNKVAIIFLIDAIIFPLTAIFFINYYFKEEAAFLTAFLFMVNAILIGITFILYIRKINAKIISMSQFFIIAIICIIFSLIYIPNLFIIKSAIPYTESIKSILFVVSIYSILYLTKLVRIGDFKTLVGVFKLAKTISYVKNEYKENSYK